MKNGGGIHKLLHELTETEELLLNVHLDEVHPIGMGVVITTFL